MNDCLFCKIIKGDIPSSKIYENEFVYAFKDIEPQAPFHAIIVPKEHIASADEITTDNSHYIAKIFEAVAEIAKLEKGLSLLATISNVVSLMSLGIIFFMRIAIALRSIGNRSTYVCHSKVSFSWVKGLSSLDKLRVSCIVVWLACCVVDNFILGPKFLSFILGTTAEATGLAIGMLALVISFVSVLVVCCIGF